MTFPIFKVITNKYSRCLKKDRLVNSLAIVQNITSLNRNLEKLTLHYLDEINFLFNIVGVTETKMIKSNEIICTPEIPGYNFENVSTPLATKWLSQYKHQEFPLPVFRQCIMG